ncbi:MAG: aminoglycoside phosphotransferase family protein [Clostridiales bacterium]|nr:aminoglycoside phosphotransferase family protein [Clostridiales bacterium]
MSEEILSGCDPGKIFSQFEIDAEFISHEHLKVGHINDTFLVEAQSYRGRDRFIFQRINRFVFRQPEKLMANFEKITRHIRSKLEKMPGRNPERETLNLVGTKSGRSFHLTDEGDYWRAYRFVGDCHIVNVAARPEQAFEAGRAFGCFQRLLADLPAISLHETIPFFHHTPRRLARLKEALAKDPCGRADEAKEAVSFALEREEIAPVVTGALDRGIIPLRIAHNDTKINNILFDNQTEKAVCIIDLDTTMPGSALYDFGDMVRTTTSLTAEDEEDVSKVELEMDMFRALAEGYLEETRDFLTDREADLLVFSGQLLTYTIGLRFLTDYLEGDVYFRTNRSGQNLDRARTQFALIKSMEKKEREMEACIRSLRRS